MFKKVAIVGIGETRVGKIPDRTTIQLQAEAVELAMKDAGIPLKELGGLLAFSGFTSPSLHHSLDVCGYLGIKATFALAVDAGGLCTPMLGIFTAASAIASGQAKVVACAFGENALSARKPDSHGWRVTSAAYPIRQEFEYPYGAEAQLISFALLSQRYMHEYNCTSRQLGAVAVAMRKHASLNPAATKRDLITIEDHQASRMVASPLHLLDFSLLSDGAGALILASEEIAKDLKVTPVRIIGNATSTFPQNINHLPDASCHQTLMREAAQEAFRQSGISVSDLDLFLVYDGFTAAVLLFIEGIGLCEIGQGGPYVAEGRLELGNRPACNPHGGLLSHAHNGGIFHFTEAVRQLRGEGGVRQVKNAQIALIGGWAGLASSQAYGIMLFERG